MRAGSVVEAKGGRRPVIPGRAALVVIHVIRPRFGPRSNWVGLGNVSVIPHRHLAYGTARLAGPRGVDWRRNEAPPRRRRD